MRRLTLLAAVATVSFASPAYAQSMGSMPGMKMPGTSMPAKEKPKPKASKPAAPKKKKPAAKPRAHAERRATAPSAHQHHDMSTMPGMAMPTPSQEQQHGTGGQSMPGMATPAPTEPQHAGQEMQAMPGMAADKTEATQGGTNLPAGDAPPPRDGRLVVGPSGRVRHRSAVPAAYETERPLVAGRGRGIGCDRVELHGLWP